MAFVLLAVGVVMHHTAKSELLKIRSYLLTSMNAYKLLFLEEFSSLSMFHLCTILPSLLLKI